MLLTTPSRISVIMVVEISTYYPNDITMQYLVNNVYFGPFLVVLVISFLASIIHIINWKIRCHHMPDVLKDSRVVFLKTFIVLFIFLISIIIATHQEWHWYIKIFNVLSIFLMIPWTYLILKGFYKEKGQENNMKFLWVILALNIYLEFSVELLKHF